MNIGVGSVVKSKVGDMDDNTREGRTRRIGKEVVRCVHDVVGNKKFIVKVEDGQKRDMSFFPLFYIFSK